MKLLIATDFSDNANQAADFALNCFGKAGAEVLLVNAVQIKQAGAVMVTSISSELESEAMKSLEVCVADFQKKFPDVNFSYQTRSGSLAQVLTYYSDSYNPDMIVMGTNGATGIYEKIIGSNTSEVMNLMTRPLMVVPYNYQIDEFDTVMIALEEVDADEDKVELVVEMCKKLNCQLHVMHFMSEHERAESYTFNTGMFDGVRFSLDQIRTISGDIEDHILNFAKKDGVDILCVIPHHKTLFKSLFHRSATEKIMKESTVPMLIL